MVNMKSGRHVCHNKSQFHAIQRAASAVLAKVTQFSKTCHCEGRHRAAERAASVVPATVTTVGHASPPLWRGSTQPRGAWPPSYWPRWRFSVRPAIVNGGIQRRQAQFLAPRPVYSTVAPGSKACEVESRHRPRCLLFPSKSDAPGSGLPFPRVAPRARVRPTSSCEPEVTLPCLLQMPLTSRPRTVLSGPVVWCGP